MPLSKSTDSLHFLDSMDVNQENITVMSMTMFGRLVIPINRIDEIMPVMHRLGIMDRLRDSDDDESRNVILNELLAALGPFGAYLTPEPQP